MLIIPFPSPLRLGNQSAASQGDTELPRHKSHTHTTFHRDLPFFILLFPPFPFSFLSLSVPHPLLLYSPDFTSVFPFSLCCLDSLVITHSASLSLLLYISLFSNNPNSRVNPLFRPSATTHKDLCLQIPVLWWVNAVVKVWLGWGLTAENGMKWTSASGEKWTSISSCRCNSLFVGPNVNLNQLPWMDFLAKYWCHPTSYFPVVLITTAAGWHLSLNNQ